MEAVKQHAAKVYAAMSSKEEQLDASCQVEAELREALHNKDAQLAALQQKYDAMVIILRIFQYW